MSLGLILVILLVIFLLGGFSGRFGGYGYGYGNGGIGVMGIILIILVVLLLTGRLNFLKIRRHQRKKSPNPSAADKRQSAAFIEKALKIGAGELLSRLAKAPPGPRVH